MNTARHRYGVLILSTAISLGLMALSASAAQAATWMVNGTNVTSDLSVGITATVEKLPGTEEKHIVLKSTIGGASFAMLCEKIEFRNAVMHAGGIATAEFWWSGCHLNVNGEEAAGCQPQEPIILSEKGETEKEEGKLDEELETLGTVEFGEECALGEQITLSGIYWAEETNGEWEVEKLAHTVREAMSVALSIGGLKLGANPAYLEGNIKLELNDGGPKKFSALL